MGTSNLYSEWRAFYTEKVSSWMSLEELRAECGKLTTTDGTSPELLLIHAMHALEECVQRDEALLRQALSALECSDWYMGQLELIVYSPDDTGTHYVRAKVRSTIAALRERLGEQA